MTIKAVYRDRSGNQYSCPVVKTPDGWKLSTTFGLRGISYYIEGSDAVGGVLEFKDYEIDPEQKLRSADYIPYINRIRVTLPWPQKPTAPPTLIPEPPNFRLHVEPGGNPFRALQTSGAEGEAEYRANRQRARQQALQTMNETTAANVQKNQAARRLNNEHAQQMRPRGRGAYIIKGEE